MFIVRYENENSEWEMFNDIEQALEFYNKQVESKKYDQVYLEQLLKEYNIYDKFLL